MKSYPHTKMLAAIIGALLLFLPMIAETQMVQMPQTGAGNPPIGQQLVREGELAVKLVVALGVGDVAEEAEAESGLAAIGIAPKHGWIADYPVTPDIAGELRLAVAEVADAGKLSIDRERALNEFDNVLAGFGLPITPYSEEIAGAGEPVPSETPVVPEVNEEVVNNYYYTEGPPVVTYYPPPPTYSYLYYWVPYPFYTTGYRFYGFFILQDFHRKAHFHHRSFYVTNHYRDRHTHRVYRIHHKSRYKSDSNSHHYRRDSSNSSGRVHYNHSWSTSGDGSARLSRSERVFRHQSSGRSIRTRQSGSTPDTVVAPSPQRERSFNTSSGRSGWEDRRSLVRGRTSTPAATTGRNFSRQSVRSGRDMSGVRSVESSGRGSGEGRSFNRSSARDNRSFNWSSSRDDNRSFSRSSSRWDNRSFNRSSPRGDNRSFNGSSSRGGQSSRGGGRGRR